MSDLTLAPSDIRSPYNRYAAGKRRSPAALAAAFVLNGGVFALLLALPATQDFLNKDPGLKVNWVKLPPDPPVNPPEPVRKEKPLPTQTKIAQPDPLPLPFIPEPQVRTGNDAVITGSDFVRGDTGKTIISDPPVLPHVPVFRAAARDPRYADAFHPDYPPALRRLELEGSVTVRVTIDAKGRVTAVELVDATDPAFFRETRDQALRHWRFLPATRDGQPVESQQTLTVQFRLDA